jgi:nucleoside-diphosphate-sugar epimerase
MRIFVTGATGWIGSASVDELLANGHNVLGLARSDASAAALAAKGAEVLRGSLDDLDSLRAGARDVDAVLHLANKHDWSNPAESNRAERAAVETLGEALVGTERPFAIASGLLRPDADRLAVETDPNPGVGPDAPRGGSENRAFDFIDQGVRAMALRCPPTVHGVGDHGFITRIAAAARRNGQSVYLGEGANAWSAVHRLDAARLVRLGLEGAPAGARLHAVAEERITTRAIAEAVGAAVGVPAVSVDPADAPTYLGFLGMFFGMEMTASSAATQATYGWVPSGPTLLEDIANGAYSG